MKFFYSIFSVKIVYKRILSLHSVELPDRASRHRLAVLREEPVLNCFLPPPLPFFLSSGILFFGLLLQILHATVEEIVPTSLEEVRGH